MDLTRIDALTRQVLEQEAAKRGVRNPHQRSRGELVRLIVRHDYGSVHSMRDAGRLMGQAMQTAVAALPVTIATLDRLRARLSLPARVSAKRAPARSEPAGWQAAATPAQQRTAAPAAQPTPPPSAAASTAPRAISELRDPNAPSTRSFVEEPIRTHSMARLLAVQGHRERSLAIYEELLAKNNADAALGREAGAVRDGHALTFAPGELPEPPSRNDALHNLEALASHDDRVECEARGEGTLCVRWSVSGAGLERARMLLGSSGELAVRVVSIQPDPARVVRSEITEHGPIARDGEWTTKLGVAGVRSFASVGLRDEGRFVSIAHARAE